jgi:hypothetical protein
MKSKNLRVFSFSAFRPKPPTFAEHLPQLYPELQPNSQRLRKGDPMGSEILPFRLARYTATDIHFFSSVSLIILQINLIPYICDMPKFEPESKFIKEGNGNCSAETDQN